MDNNIETKLHIVTDGHLTTKPETGTRNFSSPSQTPSVAQTSVKLSHVAFTSSLPSTTPTTSSSDQVKQASIWRIIERNATYVFEQSKHLVNNRVRTTKSHFPLIICALIVSFYVINVCTTPAAVDDTIIGHDEYDEARASKNSPIVDLFTFTPGNIISPRRWLWSVVSTLTYPFIELHWWLVIIDLCVITLSATLIEPLWGQLEWATFFVFVNISVAFLTTIHFITLYSIRGDASYLYKTTIAGLAGYCAAVCVTVKQLLPDSVLVSTNSFKLKNSNVPLTALMLGILMYLLNLTDGGGVLLFFYGLIMSWLYLRFIQYHPSNGHRGDLSESFALASFFPSVLKPGVTLVCNTVYEFFVKIHLCPPVTTQYQRILSERLTQDHHRRPIRPKHFKAHQSGDYEHLHQPPVQNL